MNAFIDKVYYLNNILMYEREKETIKKKTNEIVIVIR